MVNIYILIIVLSTLGCSNSEQENMDILQNEWLLTTIRLQGETLILNEDSYPNESSYLLIFNENSTFVFDTSVNSAIGSFSLDNRNIRFRNYSELTEVAPSSTEQLRIDESLLNEIPNVRSFSIDENELVLFSENGEFVFKNNSL